MSRLAKPAPRIACRLLIVLAAHAAVAISPAVASAEARLPGGASEMSLVFNGESARLAGSSALVPVKCLGSQNGLCSGTVTLAVKGHRHKVPFSLSGGSAQSLVVPVGAIGDLGGKTAVAVARTAQSAGGYSRATGVLRFR